MLISSANTGAHIQNNRKGKDGEDFMLKENNYT